MTTPPEAAGIPSPNYTVLKDIPAGAWGPRFLAEDHRLGRKVHLHLLPPPASLAVGYLEQLRKDVEAVSRLNDMHLVRVYAMEEMGGRWILVAEPVDGETLDGRIRREGVVATDESTAIVIQVSRGLHYAHRQGVAHPGLRPSKVVMAGGLAKILDVGLTSLPGIPEETGASAYRPPEQRSGPAVPDVRADFYALGAIYYHLVTGTPPDTGSPSVPVPDSRDLRPSIPDGVACVIRRLMARRREDRYPDNETLLADLERVIDGAAPVSPAIEQALTVVAPPRLPRPPASPLAPASPALEKLSASMSPSSDDEDTRLDLPPVKGRQAPPPPVRSAPAGKAVPTRTVPSRRPPVTEKAAPPVSPKRPPPSARTGKGPVPAAPEAERDSATFEKMVDQSVRDTADQVRRVMPVLVTGTKRAASWTSRAVAPLVRSAKERPKAAAVAAAMCLLVAIVIYLLARGGGAGEDASSVNGAAPAPVRQEPAPGADPREPATPPPVSGPVVPPPSPPPVAVAPNPSTPPPVPQTDYAALSGEAWSRAVGGLSGEDQVRRVIEKLRQLNPGYDGRETHAIAGPRVRGLFLAGVTVKEISPVRALSGLEQLGIGSTGVSDLSPLRGLPLVELVCAETPVKDLVPLRGMPLVRLDCRGVEADLAPLGACPLKEIECDFRPAQDAVVLRAIASLERINGMPAEAFWASADEAAAMAAGAPPDDPAWAKALDLLALVDPAQDAVRGGWAWRGKTLVSDTTDGARLELPYAPPDEYDFRVRFTRQGGAGEVVHVLARSGRSLAWQMGAAGNTLFGFVLTRGAGAGEEPPERRMAWCLENGRPYTADVKVRKDGLAVALNGRPVADWRTSLQGIGPAAVWALKHGEVLGLGSQSSPTVFHAALLREVTGRGRFLRPPPGVAGDGTGLRGDYFVGKYLEGKPVFTRVDPVIDFAWDVDPPDTRMPADSFSVRWTGEVQAAHTERYTFHVIADDGARLWVDGQALADDWNYSGRRREGSGTVELQAGRRYAIRLEYVEFRSEASVRLMWSGASTPKAVIPRRQLHPAP